MRIVSFAGGRVGAVVDDHVVDLTDLVEPGNDVSWPPLNPVRLIAAFDELRPVVADRLENGPRRPLVATPVEAPVTWPNKLIAYPTNYVDHIAEMQSRNRADLNGFFLKANSSLSGPAEPIVVPGLEGYEVHHEAELAVYIGAGGRCIPRASALDHVFGYSCLLDVTVRGPQERVMRKSFDSFTPLGPAIVTADEVADPDALDIRLEVNGEVRQAANTGDMILSVAEMIELASSAMTLLPGDIIATGTPAGVGPLRAGDAVEVRIDGLEPLSVAVTQGPPITNVAFERARS